MEGTALLVWGVVFGALGLGYFTYGKRQKAVVPLCVGLALVALPYFAPNVYILAAVGVVLVALPWFVRV